ncbi:luciferin sulfotransferase-like [Phlebotomus papatasi]|uniref:luciferin sulfotransferase-like n=1 Tax=Phlebotomus papatasi TaxID=29031 RepID=UPI002483AC00|nr:luciferin sulfotransferase-like [Phlebotomus papatasi]
MPFTCEILEPSEVSKRVTYYQETGFIRVKNNKVPENFPCVEKLWSDGYCLSSRYENYVDEIENFKIREDDVWVVTYPKCGTTWAQEMVWQICNDLQLNTSCNLSERFPFFEAGCMWNNWPNKTLNFLNDEPSPRFFKSHLPASLLPKQIWTVKPRIVYVARNMKDVMVSFYHHYRNICLFSGTFSDFAELFMDNRVYFSPFDSHILNFWHMKDKENILFLTYEDMKTDLPAVIEKTADFLGKSLSRNQIKDLADHLSFENFSKNPYVNYQEEILRVKKEFNLPRDFNFIRRGKVNSYKDEMSGEMINTIDSWLENRDGVADLQ